MVTVGMMVSAPPPPPEEIENFWEILKKTLPMASTLIRAAEVGRLGAVIVSVPSLDVLATKTEKLFPSSVERDILTLVQFTGEPDVPATSHFTSCDEPAIQVVAKLG